MKWYGRTTWWASVALHTVALVVLRQMPVQAREPAMPETVELVAPPEPPPPPPAPPTPPPPEPEPEAKPEPAPEPPPADTPPPPPPPKAAKPAPKAGPAIATADGPGSADAPVIAGDFSGGSSTESAPPPSAPAPAAPAPKAAEPDEPKCTEALVKAKPLETPQPVMTEAMRDAGLAGKVRIELKLDEEGHVVSAKVVDGLGPGFDEAALAAARSYTFAPATKCGEPVRSTFSLSIRFTL